jgi:chromosome segregation ATPase
LYSVDPERIEKENAAWRADLEREHEQELDDKDSEIQRLEETISQLEADLQAVSQLEADLQAIDDGVTVAQLRAELTESQAAVRAWRNRCIEMQEEAKKARKRRVRTIETA